MLLFRTLQPYRVRYSKTWILLLSIVTVIVIEMRND